MANNIRVTPEELNTQGGDLVKYAGDLTEVLANVDKKIQEIIAGWDGFAQDEYYSMYQNMKKDLDKFPELVDALGQATISTAKAYSEVDSQLQQGFSKALN